MSKMYERIEELCKTKNITVGAMCTEIGVNRSVLSELKTGRTKELSPKTLRKVADFFGVTTDYLQGNKEGHNIEKGELSETAVLIAKKIEESSEKFQEALKNASTDEYQIEQIPITMNCRVDFKDRVVYVNAATLKKRGIIFPLGCSGCEMWHVCDECKSCCANAIASVL